MTLIAFKVNDTYGNFLGYFPTTRTVFGSAGFMEAIFCNQNAQGSHGKLMSPNPPFSKQSSGLETHPGFKLSDSSSCSLDKSFFSIGKTII